VKCVICILRGTANKDISTSNPVQDAVDNAKQAVTVYGGKAYCTEHLHEEVVSDIEVYTKYESVPRTRG
jgi:hypothetical protein